MGDIVEHIDIGHVIACLSLPRYVRASIRHQPLTQFVGLASFSLHYWLALGHLAEAEDELVDEHPHLAGLVREERKQLEGLPRYQVPFADLITKVSEFGGYDVSIMLTPDEAAQEDER